MPKQPKESTSTSAILGKTVKLPGKIKQTDHSLLQDCDKYAQFCTMAYGQVFGGRVARPEDPFDPRNQALIKDKAAKGQQTDFKQTIVEEVGVVPYKTDYDDINFKKSVFYDGESYFEPPVDIANNIGKVFTPPSSKDGCNEINSENSNENSNKDGNIEVYLFEGVTGKTEEHEGVHSTMGYVAYNKETGEITVTFRGSRSGNALEAAAGGIAGVGNADWISDMRGELVERPDICPSPGKVAAGFADTYLTCREDILEIMKKIHDDHPEAKPKLVTTGHSLGGALATIMYMDANRGTLMKEVEKKCGQVFAGNLKEDGPKCFAFSPPQLCNKTAADQLATKQDGSSNMHRIFHKNDPVVFGGNIVKVIQGKDADESAEILVSVKGDDVDLGKCKLNANPHELRGVHEQVQADLGKSPEERNRYWHTVKIIDGKWQIVSPIKGEKPHEINAQQAANIVKQFNVDNYFKLFRERAVSAAGGLEDTELVKYIDGTREEFEKIDPYKDPEEFKKQLNSAIEGLDSKSNDSPELKEQKRKVALQKSLIAAGEFFKIVGEFFKGVGKWATSDPEIEKSKKEDIEKSVNSVVILCEGLSNYAKEFAENVDKLQFDPSDKELQEFNHELSNKLQQLETKIADFQSKIVDVGNKQERRFVNVLSKDLKKGIEAYEELLQGLSNGDLSEEEYKKKSKTLDKCVNELSYELDSIKDQKKDIKHAVREVFANIGMFVTGFFSGITKGLASFIMKKHEADRANENFFAPARATKKYMKKMLGGVLMAANVFGCAEELKAEKILPIEVQQQSMQLIK